MPFSRNIWWNLAYPLSVNRVRLSEALTVICWHLRLGGRLGAFQINTIRWCHNSLAPLTVTVTVSVAFRNVTISEWRFSSSTLNMGNLSEDLTVPKETRHVFNTYPSWQIANNLQSINANLSAFSSMQTDKISLMPVPWVQLMRCRH